MTNKDYVNGLVELYNSAKENITNFQGLEEPLKEIENENCDLNVIVKELNNKGFKTETKYSNRYKTNVLFLFKS